MVLLPTGQVIIINGAGAGLSGWERGQEPTLSPVVYSPDAAAGTRFAVQQPANIPRLYHSTAILLRDCRVLVGGSNPHIFYNFTGVKYPTELSLEAFSPDYLSSKFSSQRPRILLSVSSPLAINYGKQFVLRFSVGILGARGVSVTMVAPPFATHSFSMNQRLLVLNCGKASRSGPGASIYEIFVMAPTSAALAPPGHYMVFVVNDGIPSEGIWCKI